VSYVIESHASRGAIEAAIEPLPRGKPACIVVRMCHPDGKRIKAVTVNGKPHDRFDAAKETVAIEPSDTRVLVRTNY
jgi:hypothetical protein